MDNKKLISQTFINNKETYFKYALKLTKNTEEAEDLLQTSILKALKNSKSFTETNINGWFYTIIKNTFINNYRTNKKRLEFMDENQSMDSKVAFNDVESNMNLELIQNEIHAIGDALSKPFMMYYEGYKYNEISEILEIPMGTVKTRIRACRVKLIEALKHHYPNKSTTIKNV